MMAAGGKASFGIISQPEGGQLSRLHHPCSESSVASRSRVICGGGAA
jgi:hypothetical protein